MCESGDSFDQCLAHELTPRADVTGGPESGGPVVEALECGEDVLGWPSRVQGGDAVGLWCHRHSGVGPVASRPLMGCFGIDTDHDPGSCLARLGSSHPDDLRGDLTIGDNIVVDVQAAGLAGDGPRGGLADDAGREQGEHLGEAAHAHSELELGAGRSGSDVASHGHLADD